jgi:hypothetical protein
MKKREVINSEQVTIFYRQEIEAETKEEAIEKAHELGDWEEFDQSGNGDSETEANEIE